MNKYLVMGTVIIFLPQIFRLTASFPFLSLYQVQKDSFFEWDNLNSVTYSFRFAFPWVANPHNTWLYPKSTWSQSSVRWPSLAHQPVLLSSFSRPWNGWQSSLCVEAVIWLSPILSGSSIPTGIKKQFSVKKICSMEVSGGTFLNFYVPVSLNHFVAAISS